MGGRGRPVWKNRKIFPLAAKELDSETGYKFTAKELDQETGYYYFGARYYDPKVSMWISTDPAIGKYLPTADQLFFPEDKFDFRSMPGIGGVYNSVNLNVYHYAGQNPVKLVDPDGNIAIAPAVPLILEGLKWTVGAILGLAGVYQAAISKDDARPIPNVGVQSDVQTKSRKPSKIYHRIANERTQTKQDSIKQTISGELWGKERNNSTIKQVQAYSGPLPPNKKGIEFTTDTSETPGSPPGQARWVEGSPGVFRRGKYVGIKIKVIKNTQILD